MHPVERSIRLSDWCDARMRLYANCAGDGGQAQCGGGGGGEAAESKVTASRYDDMRKLVGPGARTVLIGILQYSRSHLRGSHKHRNRKFVTVSSSSSKPASFAFGYQSTCAFWSTLYSSMPPTRFRAPCSTTFTCVAVALLVLLGASKSAEPPTTTNS